MLSSRSILCCFLAATMLFIALCAVPVWSQMVVPYEWITPGAYAKYESEMTCDIFYPNWTRVLLPSSSLLLEWTVLDRVGDSVLLNVTFVAEGMAMVYYEESIPDGIVNILDIALVAKAFGKGVYEWGFTPNADVTGPTGEPDQKVNILDISLVAVSFGSSPSDSRYGLEADIAPEETKEEHGYHLHRKTLLLDIDVYSRDTFLDGKPLGKTCFWAEPYANVGDTVVLYDLPGEIVGNVIQIDEEWASSYGWTGVTTYRVYVLQYDPFVWMYPYFDWHTGMAIQIFLLGDRPVNPDGQFYHNGTRITRFASTSLGTLLNVGTLYAYELTLNSTNVQLGPPT